MTPKFIINVKNTTTGEEENFLLGVEDMRKSGFLTGRGSVREFVSKVINWTQGRENTPKNWARG